MKYQYLLIDTLVILIPLIFSFHPGIRFYKFWKPLFSAIISAAIPFLFFDSLFTLWGVWSFNPRYITGIYLLNLPIEEILFFICVPYSCLFTFYCLNQFYRISWKSKTEDIFCVLFAVILIISGVIFRNRLYTCSTFIATACLCIFLKFVIRVDWFGKAVTVYGVLLLPFLIVNGILTGTGLAEPVVIYNPSQNMNIRFFTIPLEDFVYGFELFLLNLFLFSLYTGATPLVTSVHQPREM